MTNFISRFLFDLIVILGTVCLPLALLSLRPRTSSLAFADAIGPKFGCPHEGYSPGCYFGFPLGLCRGWLCSSLVVFVSLKFVLSLVILILILIMCMLLVLSCKSFDFMWHQ